MHDRVVPPKPGKVMYSIRLDPAHKRLLALVKAQDGIPESEQIRRGLLLWFAEKGVMRARSKRRV
jgi:hypothetical protein